MGKSTISTGPWLQVRKLLNHQAGYLFGLFGLGDLFFPGRSIWNGHLCNRCSAVHAGGPLKIHYQKVPDFRHQHGIFPQSDDKIRLFKLTVRPLEAPLFLKWIFQPPGSRVFVRPQFADLIISIGIPICYHHVGTHDDSPFFPFTISIHIPILYPSKNQILPIFFTFLVPTRSPHWSTRSGGSSGAPSSYAASRRIVEQVLEQTPLSAAAKTAIFRCPKGWRKHRWNTGENRWRPGKMMHWLMVWNHGILWLSIYWEEYSQLTFIVFKMVKTANQWCKMSWF